MDTKKVVICLASEGYAEVLTLHLAPDVITEFQYVLKLMQQDKGGFQIFDGMPGDEPWKQPSADPTEAEPHVPNMIPLPYAGGVRWIRTWNIQSVDIAD